MVGRFVVAENWLRDLSVLDGYNGTDWFCGFYEAAVAGSARHGQSIYFRLRVSMAVQRVNGFLLALFEPTYKSFEFPPFSLSISLFLYHP